jgi:hypothetical protein
LGRPSLEQVIAIWLVGPPGEGYRSAARVAPYLAQPETAYGVAAGFLFWWSPTVQTTRVQLMFAAALVFGRGVELLRRQTAREIPAPPPPGLGRLRPQGMGRVRGRVADDNRLEALERLGRLHEQGVLTDEEFAAEKASLMRQ